MSYYPNPTNYYFNYPYGNQPVQQQPNISMPQQTPLLNGKVVDSADVVRATEVPIGGYGIFPKADLSEVYVKSWNNNGTTSIITFKPEPPQANEEPSSPLSFVEIKEQIERLETKVDNLCAAVQVKDTDVQTPAAAERKVVFNV